VANYSSVFTVRRLWIILGVSMLVMFGTLLYVGAQIYQAAPPIPIAFRSAAGDPLFTRDDIERGQNVWQSIGGMEQGSIWGHGSYVAPDWSADWLHRESTFVLDEWGNSEFGKPYGQLSEEDQGRLRGASSTRRKKQMLRHFAPQGDAVSSGAYPSTVRISSCLVVPGRRVTRCSAEDSRPMSRQDDIHGRHPARSDAHPSRFSCPVAEAVRRGGERAAS
jgi:hypothetical protein